MSSHPHARRMAAARLASLALGVPALVSFAAGTALAQAPAAKPLGRANAEYGEPFTSVASLRELSDGRVVVVDPRDKVIQVIDLKTGRATSVGREGSGPNEYGLPLRVLGLGGDTTLVADVLNSRFLIVGPRGQPAGTWNPTADAVAARSAGRVEARSDERRATPVPAGARPNGGGQRVVLGGPGAVMQMSAADGQGRLYGTGREISVGPDGPVVADSVPLERLDRRTGRTDTLAWLSRDQGNAKVSGSGGNMNVRIGGGAFPMNDAFTVFPDGRIAIVRAKSYRVDIVQPDGRFIRGATVNYTPVKVDEAVKERWRASRRGQTGIMITQDAGPGGNRRSVNSAPVTVQDPDEWPAVLPAVTGNPIAMPGGTVWVQRNVAGNYKGTLYDVFDANGRLTSQVRVPEKVRIVAGGRQSVYAVRIDEDDLQYLQRYAAP